MYRIKAQLRLAGVAGALFCLVFAPAQLAHASEIRKPGCAALENWAAAIDGKDRVSPVQGNRAWVPRAFLDPSFAELFGLSALEWRSADASAMARHLYVCAKAAGKARRVAARNALYAARSYMTGNLRGVLALRERAAQRAARDGARKAQQAKRESARRAQQEAQRARERSRLAARQRARQEATAPAAAKEDARRGASRQSQDAEQHATRRNDRRLRAAAPPGGRDDAAVEAALAKVLAEQDPQRLLRTLSKMRHVDLQDTRSYSQTAMRLGVAPRNLLYILRRQGRNMDDPLVAPKLEARYQELRASIVDDYRSRIAKLDATPDGLRFLDRWQEEVRRKVVPVLGQDGAAPIFAAIDERRRSIRDDFVPKAVAAIDRIAQNPGDDIGALRRINRIVINMESSGISREQLKEVTAHAQSRGQPIANRVLKAEVSNLDDYPKTLKGLKQVLRVIKRVRNGELAGSSPDLKAGYLDKAHKRLADIGGNALAEFKAGLSTVPESGAGLVMLDRSIVSDPGFQQEVPASMRDAYVEALNERRRQVRAARASNQAAQRRTAIAAGGNPDLVGYWFANAKSGIRIGFRNEKVAIVAVKGKMDTAPYKIVGDRIRITTPGLPMLFALSGSGPGTKLKGLGMQFERLAK